MLDTYWWPHSLSITSHGLFVLIRKQRIVKKSEWNCFPWSSRGALFCPICSLSSVPQQHRGQEQQQVIDGTDGGNSCLGQESGHVMNPSASSKIPLLEAHQRFPSSTNSYTSTSQVSLWTAAWTFSKIISLTLSFFIHFHSEMCFFFKVPTGLTDVFLLEISTKSVALSENWCFHFEARQSECSWFCAGRIHVPGGRL